MPPQLSQFARKELLTAGSRLKAQLTEIADDIDKHEKNVNIAKVSAATAGAAGGGMVVAGIIALPFTFGLSAVLIAGGAAVGAASGLTASGAHLTGFIINQDKKDNVEKAWKAFEDKFFEYIGNLVEEEQKNISAMRENIQQIIKPSSPSTSIIRQLVTSLTDFLYKVEKM